MELHSQATNKLKKSRYSNIFWLADAEDLKHAYNMRCITLNSNDGPLSNNNFLHKFQFEKRKKNFYLFSGQTVCVIVCASRALHIAVQCRQIFGWIL